MAAIAATSYLPSSSSRSCTAQYLVQRRPPPPDPLSAAQDPRQHRVEEEVVVPCLRLQLALQQQQHPCHRPRSVVVSLSSS